MSLTLQHLRILFAALAALLAGILAWNLAAEHREMLRRERGGDRATTRVLPQVAPPAPTIISTPAIDPPTTPAAPPPHNALSDRMGEVPDYKTFRDRFAASFPGDWTRAVEVMGQPRADGLPSDTPDALFLETLKTLRRSRGALASKAASEPLSAVFTQQMRLLAALSSTDKRLCVDFLFGEDSRGFLAFAGTHRPLLVALAGAALDAVIDGAAKRIERPAPTDADFALLEKMLTERGLGAAEIEALLDGRHPDPPIADDRLCDAGLVYYDVLKQLPEDARLRIYALSVELMSRL